MVDDQKVAEERRVVSVKMAGELAVQNEEVEKRSRVVEEDLGKAEPALLDAQSAVRGIKRSQLDEIRNLLKPPEAIRLTMEAVLLLLGHEETAWPAVRKIMKGHDFIHCVVDFQSDQISDSARETIRKKYQGKHGDIFNYEKVNRASRACGPLLQWILSQLDYSEIIVRVQPLRDEMEALEVKRNELKEKHDAVEAEVVELVNSIAQYKAEYAELIAEVERIKNEITSVRSKCERSTTLLASLGEERDRLVADLLESFLHRLRSERSNVHFARFLS